MVGAVSVGIAVTAVVLFPSVIPADVLLAENIKFNVLKIQTVVILYTSM